jgi:transposase
MGFFSNLDESKVALEACHNWGLLYDLLCLIGLDVHICDAREARLIGQNRVKTDKNDAYRLAALLKSGFLPECYVPSGDCRALRELVRARASVRRMATRIKNQIHAILSSNWIKHPYSDLFGKAGREFLVNLQVNDCSKMLILSKLALLDSIEEQASILEAEIVRRAHLDKRAMLLMTIPGIGELTALVILSEIGDISRFGQAKSLVNFAGLHPGEDSSGERTRRSGITKEGSAWLRWILVEAAQHTIKQDGKIRDLYLRVLTRKGHNKAIVAAAREMLVAIYWMLSRMEPYRPTGKARTSILTGESR